MAMMHAAHGKGKVEIIHMPIFFRLTTGSVTFTSSHIPLVKM